jgi:hypothetical protein
VIGIVALLLAWRLAYQDMRLAGRLMLALEALAMIAIIFLCFAIVHRVRPGGEQLAASFRPERAFNGWVGLGFGMVFSMLSFAGFEGAATLGEETVNPRRAIPVALIGAVLLCAVFFVFVSYCEVVGFGPDGMRALASSEAPLDELSRRYVSANLSIALDLAAATTCFSGTIGAIAAGGRVLYALGRVGLWRKLAEVHPVHGTPAPAIAVTTLLIIHWRAGTAADLYRRRCCRGGGGATRAAALVGGHLHARTRTVAVGALLQHLSGACLSQQPVAVRYVCVDRHRAAGHPPATGAGRGAIARIQSRCGVERLDVGGEVVYLLIGQRLGDRRHDRRVGAQAAAVAICPQRIDHVASRLSADLRIFRHHRRTPVCAVAGGALDEFFTTEGDTVRSRKRARQRRQRHDEADDHSNDSRHRVLSVGHD